MKISQLFLFAVSFLTVVSAFPSPFKMFKKHAVTPEDATAALDKYMGKLRRLVTEDGVDKAGYRKRGKKDNEDLCKSAMKAEMFEDNEYVTNQLMFARNCFINFRHVCYYEVDNTVGKNPAEDLITDIMELDIWLLLLQDSHGDPNPDADRYRDIVMGYRSKLEKLRTQFSPDLRVSSSQKETLESLIGKVDKEIMKMEAIFPEE